MKAYLYQSYITHAVNKYVQRRRKDVYYIHELLQCFIKSQILKQLPSVVLLLDNIKDRMIIGEAIHEGLLQMFKQLGFNEPQEICKTVMINSKEVTICGTCDLLINDTVVEIKYMTQPRKFQDVEKEKTGEYKPEPLPHHVLQTQLYMWLYETKKGILLLVVPPKIYEYIIEPLNEDEVFKMIEEWFKKQPSPKWEWECKLCHVKKLCPRYQHL